MAILNLYFSRFEYLLEPFTAGRVIGLDYFTLKDGNAILRIPWISRTSLQLRQEAGLGEFTKIIRGFFDCQK